MTGLILATIVHWAVNPMSDVMRLPDAEPTDGEKDGVVRIAMAKDEYEPGSFVVRSDTNLGKVRFEVGDFKQVERVGGGEGGGGEDGETGVVLPKENIDLKVVKVWYQNRNAWFSYFADVGGWKLCPELLVNDEDLIRADTEKEANYARLVAKDGTVTEKWINPPADTDRRAANVSYELDSFFPMREDFRDAKTLQPIALPKGVCKQLWLTVRTTKDTPAGVYKGSITLRSTPTPNTYTYSIPVEIRVFDFVLPKPKTRPFPEMDMLINFYDYICFDILRAYNGGDLELAKRQMRAIIRDRAAHGQNTFSFRGGFHGGGDILRQKDAEEAVFIYNEMKDAGMVTKPLIKFARAGDTEHDPVKCAELAKMTARRADELFGHHDIYIGYGDEPGIEQITNRYRFVQTIWQREGFKFFLASSRAVFNKNPHLQDWNNAAEEPTEATRPALWNTIGNGKRCAWYATQHVGSENPAFNRRQNGLGAWLNGFTALANYAHHLGPYNDSSGHYKPMVYVYGIYDGPLDTIQWEGFREGVDDMRYATLLSALAREAEKSADIEVRRLGMKALGYLANLNAASDDLDEIRLEMTNYILKLKEAL